MSVLFRNPIGITFERIDYKNRSKVKVHNDGYNLRTYRFNNVECFKSPYISWENLDQCGGWATTDSYLKTAVQNGTKLFAQVIHTADSRFESSDDVLCDTKDHWFQGYKETHICRKGTLSDYYDLSAVFKHYSRLGIELTDSEAAEIGEWFDIPLRMFGTQEAPFDYKNIKTKTEFITNGLLLGYPLESTASLIEEWYL